MNFARRRLIAALGVLAVSRSVPAVAQTPGRVYRLGMLVETEGARQRLDLAVPILARQGFREGDNLVVERRVSGAAAANVAAYAAELVAWKPDAIVCSGARVAVELRAATTSVPIVMASASDPVGLGLVHSLARPGGNLTGLADARLEAAEKRLQLLAEAFPTARRIAVWHEAGIPDAKPELATLERAAIRLGVALRPFPLRAPADLDAVARGTRGWGAQSIYVANGPLASRYRREIVARVVELRLPASYATLDHVEAGGLMSYGVSNADVAARAATYIERILKGAKPADLPIEQPSKLVLVLNLKAAAALGVDFPASVLARADEVRQ